MCARMSVCVWSASYFLSSECVCVFLLHMEVPGARQPIELELQLQAYPQSQIGAAPVASAAACSNIESTH